MPKSKTVLDEDEERPAHVCVVYDSKTGRVAHVHEFFGKGFKQDECERMALDTVVKLGHVKPGGLKILHPPELKFGPDSTLRVDPKRTVWPKFQFGRMQYLKTAGFDVSELHYCIKRHTLAFILFEPFAKELVHVSNATGFRIVNHTDVGRTLFVFIEKCFGFWHSASYIRTRSEGASGPSPRCQRREE